jgi:hypothetical protein
MVENLQDFLEHGKKWEKIKTTTPGVWICKMPGNPPTLALALNLVDSSGNPIKKSYVFVRSNSELDDFKDLFSSPRVKEIMQKVSEVNPDVHEAEKVLDV